MYTEEKHEKKASNAKANTGVALGAVGTGLGVLALGAKGLFGHGRRDGYDGYDGRGNCGGRHNCAATCDDIIEIERQFNCQEREILGLALGFEKQLGANALHQQGLTYSLALKSQKDDCDLALKEACDVRDLYRYNDKTAFELYKGQRNDFDRLSERIGKVEKEAAVSAAVRPYQDEILNDRICRAEEHAEFNLWKRTCKMISGEVVLPSTPTVTGFASFNKCQPAQAEASA